MAAPQAENKRSPLKAWVRALELTTPIGRDRHLTLPVLIQRLAERFAEAPALIAPQGTLSYRALAEQSNRYARFGASQGLGPGDVTCLVMHNCPQYLAIWLGLSSIGVTVALINTHLRGPQLAHSINLVTPRCLIAGASLAGQVCEVRAQLPPALPCWVDGASDSDLPRLDQYIARLPGDALRSEEFKAPALGERALCIYTSGTTGLPKAANVSHYRLMQWSHWFAGLIDAKPSDRMYNCLPLYHSVGGVVATGATLVGGGAVVVREQFSARGFWKDVIAERCTLFQYIGELCRYLVNTPFQPHETQHQLRLACGNGLRADVWQEFQQRFHIPQVLEYYASTEGNFSLYNCEGKVGAIGRIPPFLAHRVPVALVRFDVDSGLPWRDPDGRCVRCARGEVGEALGQIVQGAGSTRFEGYTDAGASGKKVLHDVFAAGDAWYRTGDLMRQDEQGFFYFVDRVGDTFRWKGENVSTTEVAALIATCPKVSEVAVYGVSVPHADGRAGMAALVAEPGFGPDELRGVLAQLPAYARPVFIRIVQAIEITGTFKLRKQELAQQGYDPRRVSDPIYIADAVNDRFVALDAQRYAQVESGTLRL